MKNSRQLFNAFLGLCTAMCLSQVSLAQEFPMVWEADFDNKADVYSVASHDGDMLLGTTDNAACVLDKDGKPVWSGKYKDLSTNGVSKADYQSMMWDAGCLFVFDKKIGKDRITVLDIKTGKELWNTEKYSGVGEDNMTYIPEMDAFAFSLKESMVMIKARTGEEIWETRKFRGAIGKHLYLKDANELILINFKPTALGALFAGLKNQFVRINAANGEVIWDATFTGLVQKKVITREPIVDIQKVDGKVFLYLGGLQVFDYKSGQKLWESIYSTAQGVKRGYGEKVLRGGIYGAIADPMVTDDAVYIVLGGDKNKIKYVQKHDLETGKVLWTSEKIKPADAMPTLHKVGNVVVAQVGGLVNEQKVTREKNEDGSYTIYYINQWIWLGKFGVLGIDDKTGAYIWRSEKFKKRVTDLVVDDKNVYAASGVAFYSIDANSGKENYSIDHKGAKVGLSMWAFDIGDGVAIVCDKGMAAYQKSDGSMKYTTGKFKGVTNMYTVGDNFFLKNKKNEMAGVDLKTGQVKGIVRSKGKGGGGGYGDGFDITKDGEFLYAFKKKNVTKYKVNQ